jgi:hypothetical protein
MDKSADDFDEFMALEQISEKRKELESLCRLYAKPGTWDKFIAYESKMRVQRKQEAEARQRQIAATIRYISWGVIAAISIGGFGLLNFCEVTNDHSNGTHTGVEVTAARYDGGDVLRISGRLKLVYDAAARGHDTSRHCSDCDCDGCHDRYICRLAGA